MTTISLVDLNLSPQIILGDQEHRRLLNLAMSGIGHTADDSDSLLYELERATIVPEGSVPSDVVRMGSTVAYRTGDGENRSVQVVFPGEADIDQGRISVMTPIGTALIGLRNSQSISWLTRAGRKQTLTVLQVMEPMDEDNPPPSAA